MNGSAAKRPVLADAMLEGERVVLRPLVPGDAEAAFPLIHERAPVLEWLVWQGPKDVADLRKRFEHWHSSTEGGHGYRFAVVERETQSFVGTMGLGCGDPLFNTELGYWLAEEAWGRGFGSEAIKLADRLAFGYLKTTVVTAEVFVGNHASCKVLERNGFQRESRTQRAPGVPIHARGSERWFYTLTRGDYTRANADYRAPVERVDLVATG
ncbi:MAG: ribosomal-protein-alanine N-acetyltransferase [Chlamydiales bacterium]